MYDSIVTLCQKIILIFYSYQAFLSHSWSLISLYLSLSLTHFPLFLPLLYHLSVSPSYHCHSLDSRFTLQSTELHRDHQPSLKPISKLQINKIGVVAQLSWRSARWLSRSAVVGFWVWHCGCCQRDQQWWLISWWVSLLSMRSVLWVSLCVCVCVFFLLVVLVVAISCGCWLWFLAVSLCFFFFFFFLLVVFVVTVSCGGCCIMVVVVIAS